MSKLINVDDCALRVLKRMEEKLGTVWVRIPFNLGCWYHSEAVLGIKEALRLDVTPDASYMLITPIW